MCTINYSRVRISSRQDFLPNFGAIWLKIPGLSYTYPTVQFCVPFFKNIVFLLLKIKIKLIFFQNLKNGKNNFSTIKRWWYSGVRISQDFWANFAYFLPTFGEKFLAWWVIHTPLYHFSDIKLKFGSIWILIPNSIEKSIFPHISS